MLPAYVQAEADKPAWFAGVSVQPVQAVLNCWEDRDS